jgi:hypothetical protein
LKGGRNAALPERRHSCSRLVESTAFRFIPLPRSQVGCGIRRFSYFSVVGLRLRAYCLCSFLF